MSSNLGAASGERDVTTARLQNSNNTSIGKKKSTIASSDIQQYDAVIVGAGWAGIKAAETLLKGGVDNILVLEAHDYIGGR